MAVDARDLDRWEAVFTDDGELDLSSIGLPPVAGREELRKFCSSLGPAGAGMHISANPVVEVDGDVARATSYVMTVGGADDPRIRLAGRYDDELRKVDGTWRIARRRIDAPFRLKG